MCRSCLEKKFQKAALENRKFYYAGANLLKSFPLVPPQE